MKSQTYPQSEWTAQGKTVKYVSFSVTAKEMNDQLTVIVYNENGQQISETYIDSMGSYAGRQTKDVYLYDAILAFGMGAYNYFHS